MATVKGKGWIGMGGTKAAPFAWPMWRTGRPEWALINYETYAQEGFAQNAWIYGAIMYKVRAMTNAPLRAYKGTRDQPELLDADHPLAKLLDRPNPHQSWTEFHSQSIVYFNLAGECFILFDREKAEGGIPSAMYGVRPDRVVIVPIGKREVAYVYVPEGKSAWQNWNYAGRLARFKKGDITPIAPEDIMHVKLPNPLDPLEGMGHGLSPISPAAWATDTDNAATKFLKLFFDRGLMPNVVLKAEAPLDESTVARVRQRWMDIYAGTEGWLKPGVLDEGMDIQQLGYSFSELGFGEIDHRDEARIVAPFGVPGALVGTTLGLERATYSNLETLQEWFWEATMVPETLWFEADYRYYLRGERGEFVQFDFSDVAALQKDIGEQVEAWSKMVDRGVPKNVAAAIVGIPIPQLPDGDTVYMPLTMMAVGRMGGGSTVEPAPEPEEDEEGAAGSEEETRALLHVEGIAKK